MLKLIEIPIAVMGEASGSVMKESDGAKHGIARMIVNFYTKDLRPAGRTLTEDDGYYSYLGLPPGSYIVRLDPIQLKRLGMKSVPDSLAFIITANIEGDFVDGLDFAVKIENGQQIISGQPEVMVHDTTYFIIHEVVEEVMTSTTDSYALQMGAFKRKANADAYRKRLKMALGKKVEIFVENGYYKVRIAGFTTRKEVDEFIPIIKKNGIKEMWLISLKGMQKHWIITTRQDTITIPVTGDTNMQQLEKRPDNEFIKGLVKISPAIKTLKEINIISPAEPAISLQAAVFRKKSRALKAQRKIISELSLPVEVVKEYDYYKVIIRGFYTRQQTYRYYPELVGMGYPATYLIENGK